MATKTKAANGVTKTAGFSVDPDMIQRVPRRLIDFDWTFNARTPQRDPETGRIMGLDIDGSTNKSSSFSVVKASIHFQALAAAAKRLGIDELKSTDPKLDPNVTKVLESGEYQPCDGQDEAIRVRPHPKGPAHKFPLFCDAGFLRGEAIAQLAEEFKVKDPLIRVIVEERTQEEALFLNITENTGKTDFSEADFCAGVANLVKHSPHLLQKLTQVELAAKLNKSQSYFSRVQAIVTRATPKVLKEWRESQKKVSVLAMVEVVKKEGVAEQEKAFQEAQRDKDAKSKGKIKDAWVIGACNVAQEQGWRLGKTVALGYLAPKGSEGEKALLSQESMLRFVDVKTKPKGATKEAAVEAATEYAGHIETIRYAFEDGYKAGKAGKEKLKRIEHDPAPLTEAAPN